MHSSASASENENLSLRRRSGSVWLGPTVLSSLGCVMGRNSTSNTQRGCFCILAQSQSHLWQVRNITCRLIFTLAGVHLDPTGWPLSQGRDPPLQIQLYHGSYGIGSPEQSQHPHPGATISTDTRKPANGKWIPAWCPRCLIWWSARILMAALSQVT